MIGYIIVINKKIKLSSFCVIIALLIILRFTIMLMTPFTATSVNNMILPYGLLGYLTLILFIDSNINNRSFMLAIFKSLTYILTICILLNFFIDKNLHIADNIQALKTGIDTGYTGARLWLFGHRNMIFVHHLLWILSTYILCKISQKKYATPIVLELIFTILVSIISWNSTMLIATIIMSILLTLKNFNFKILNIVTYYITFLFLEIGIVFLGIQKNFSEFIVNVLHRNITFTGRTSIWNYYLEQYASGDITNKLLGNHGETHLSVNSHNMILGLLSFTGIIGLALYTSLLLISGKELYKYRSHDEAKVISIIILTFLINSIAMEFYIQLTLALYLGYRIHSILKLTNDTHIKRELTNE